MKRHDGFVRFAERRYTELSAEDEAPDLRRHTIICGFGGGGQNLARVLEGRGLPFLVIEYDPFVIDRVRAAGYDAIFGDCTNAEVLEQAGVADARMLALTFSQVSDALLAAQVARTMNPRIDIVARGGPGGAHRLLREVGVSEVVDPEFESSLELVRHVLHRFGVDGREITALQAQRRAEHYRLEA